MTIYMFPEGQTEETVLRKLCEIRGVTKQPFPARGKGNINTVIVDTISPVISSESPPPIRCLVLRDLDGHDGETPDRLVQSLTDALDRMLGKRGIKVKPTFSPLPGYENQVFVCAIGDRLRVALHIATYRWCDNFQKSTIDDYVLDLALEDSVVKHFAKELRIKPENVVKKIRHELPDLMKTNGITLNEAKDYIRMYAAVVKVHTSPAVFAQNVLAHADNDRTVAVFRSVVAALDSL